MKISAWLTSSLQRLFPLGPAGRARTLRVNAARGERVAFQVGFVISGADDAEVAITVEPAKGLPAFARRVGTVPVPHHNTQMPPEPEETDGIGMIPGYVPDPLFPLTTWRFAAGEVNAYWITVDVPADAKPGDHIVAVTLTSGQTTQRLAATIEVSKVVLQKRRDFRVTHWFYADAICDYHKLTPFEEAFWPVCERYVRNYAQHGNDTLYVPVFTPPLDGVKRPHQLLGVKRTGKDRYTFDWTNVLRWIRMAQSCGITHWEWTHPFTQWGVKHAIRVYDRPDGGKLLWPVETGATSATYRKFLAQYLPQLHRFTTEHNLLENSFFHVSDEPHGDEHVANYRAAREMLRELAPWMKCMDALSELRYGQEGLTEIPIPSIQTALQYVEAGIPSWCYFCCGPRGRYLNRLLDSPLPKIRMAGWLFYRFGFGEFLHWGYNYWYKRQTQEMIDPYHVTDAHAWPGWAYGDTFVVYPSADGPVDSIRWEVFHQSLQDYALLQTVGVERTARALAPLVGFDNYPKNEAWINAARRRLLRG